MNRNDMSVFLLLGMTLLAGCVQPAPIVDSHLGQAVTMIKAQQIINPEASRNADPVTGLDGRAATAGYDRYQRSYRVPEPQPNIFTIGIGGGR